METSIFLAKVMGIYLAIEGLALIVNKKYLIKVIRELLKTKGVIYIFSFFTLILGIMLVVGHNIWTKDWVGLVTLLGWLILVKGVMNVLFPKIGLKMAEKFTPSSWYTPTGVALIVVGAYLAAKGFALL